MVVFGKPNKLLIIRYSLQVLCRDVELTVDSAMLYTLSKLLLSVILYTVPILTSLEKLWPILDVVQMG